MQLIRGIHEGEPRPPTGAAATLVRLVLWNLGIESLAGELMDWPKKPPRAVNSDLELAQDITLAVRRQQHC